MWRRRSCYLLSIVNNVTADDQAAEAKGPRFEVIQHKVLDGNYPMALSCHFVSIDGKPQIVAAYDGVVIHWDIDSGAELKRYSMGCTLPCVIAKKHIFTVSEFGDILRYDMIEDLLSFKSIPSQGYYRVSADGRMIFVIDQYESCVKAIDFDTEAVVKTLKDLENIVTIEVIHGLSESELADRLLVMKNDGQIYQYNVQDDYDLEAVYEMRFSKTPREAGLVDGIIYVTGEHSIERFEATKSRKDGIPKSSTSELIYGSTDLRSCKIMNDKLFLLDPVDRITILNLAGLPEDTSRRRDIDVCTNRKVSTAVYTPPDSDSATKVIIGYEDGEVAVLDACTNEEIHCFTPSEVVGDAFVFVHRGKLYTIYGCGLVEERDLTSDERIEDVTKISSRKVPEDDDYTMRRPAVYFHENWLFYSIAGYYESHADSSDSRSTENNCVWQYDLTTGDLVKMFAGTSHYAIGIGIFNEQKSEDPDDCLRLITLDSDFQPAVWSVTTGNQLYTI